MYTTTLRQLLLASLWQPYHNQVLQEEREEMKTFLLSQCDLYLPYITVSCVIACCP